MLVKLHGLYLELDSDSPRIWDEWERLYAPFAVSEIPASESPAGFSLTLVPEIPAAPGRAPAYAQADLAVYMEAAGFLIYLPRLGNVRVMPAAGDAGRVEATVTPAVLDLYGAFEDVNSIGLAPLLRRRGRALIHAFGAAHRGRALLLAGNNASGKTTTGLALLAAGWKLLSNDSPMLGLVDNRAVALAYPGLLSAHPDALRRVPALSWLADDPAHAPQRPGWKIVFSAREQFLSPWAGAAPVGAICLLQIEQGASEHQVERLSPAAALGRLLPHSVDRWDQETLVFQMDLFRQLVQQAPAFQLRLGSDVPALPGLLESLLD